MAAPVLRWVDMTADGPDPAKVSVRIDGIQLYTFVKTSMNPVSRAWTMYDLEAAETIATLRVSRLFPSIKYKSLTRAHLGNHQILEWSSSDWPATRIRWRYSDRSLVKIEHETVLLPALAILDRLPTLEHWESPVRFSMGYRRAPGEADRTVEIISTAFLAAWLWSKSPPPLVETSIERMRDAFITWVTDIFRWSQVCEANACHYMDSSHLPPL